MNEMVLVMTASLMRKLKMYKMDDVEFESDDELHERNASSLNEKLCLSTEVALENGDGFAVEEEFTEFVLVAKTVA